jgi:short-subunit dehydrogenase
VHAGYDLILVARRADRLRSLAADLAVRTGRSVEILPADLTRPADLTKVEAVLRNDASIRLLINNAGTGATAPLLQSDIEEMERLIALNVNALTRLAYAVVPAFVARGAGTIINIASVAALAPDLLNGVYGASKAYVLAFSQSLQHELADQGVRVQVVLPAATATDFWAHAGRPLANLPPKIVMSVQNLVDAALAGLAQGETVTIPTRTNVADWEAFEAARKALSPILSRGKPASRYAVRPHWLR